MNGLHLLLGAATAPIIPSPLSHLAYSAADLVTIIAAFGVLVSSLIGGVVTIIATLRTGQKADKLITSVIGDESTPGLKEQVTQIHQVTNSNLERANAKIDKQTVEIQALQSMITELKSERTKKEVAEATAIVPPGFVEKK